MQLSLLYLFGGLLLLYLGGESLVRGAVGLAARLGLRPLVIGLTIVAFATSAPELAVMLDAAFEGYNDVAIGTVVGSNICNIALVLGVAALIRPIRVDPQLLRLDVPVMIGCSVLLAAMLFDNRVGRGEGLLLLLGILAYVSFRLWIAARRENRLQTAPLEVGSLRSSRTGRQALLALVGLLALAAGGYCVVRGVVELGATLGMSNAVIALTIVAFGTSLPELTTAVVASLRSYGDVAIGNVIGTNIFNVFAMLGVTATVHPLFFGGIGWWDIGVMVAMAILVVPLCWSGLRLGRFEGGLLLLCYGAYCSWKFAG